MLRRRYKKYQKAMLASPLCPEMDSITGFMKTVVGEVVVLIVFGWRRITVTIVHRTPVGDDRRDKVSDMIEKLNRKADDLEAYFIEPDSRQLEYRRLHRMKRNPQKDRGLAKLCGAIFRDVPARMNGMIQDNAPDVRIVSTSKESV